MLNKHASLQMYRNGFKVIRIQIYDGNHNAQLIKYLNDASEHSDFLENWFYCHDNHNKLVVVSVL